MKNQRRATKKERQARTLQMTRLYVDARLTLQEIASLYCIAHQTVRDRLIRSGVPIRSNRRPPTPPLDECQDDMVRLYIDERVPVYLLANRFRVSQEEIRERLLRQGLELRPTGHPPKYMELRELKLGETIMLPKPIVGGKGNGRWQEYIYGVARRLGVRFSVKSIDDVTIRVTRVK